MCAAVEVNSNFFNVTLLVFIQKWCLQIAEQVTDRPMHSYVTDRPSANESRASCCLFMLATVLSIAPAF
jgi:hypothetical protein